MKDICSLMFNQCKSTSACVELEYLLWSKTSLAHMCHAHWNFLMSQLGRPTRMALQYSRCKMQSLRTSVCVASYVRTFLIDLILFQFISTVLHLILMCFFIVRLASKCPPRNLIWSVLANVRSCRYDGTVLANVIILKIKSASLI